MGHSVLGVLAVTSDELWNLPLPLVWARMSALLLVEADRQWSVELAVGDVGIGQAKTNRDCLVTYALWAARQAYREGLEVEGPLPERYALAPGTKP